MAWTNWRPSLTKNIKKLTVGPNTQKLKFRIKNVRYSDPHRISLPFYDVKQNLPEKSKNSPREFEALKLCLICTMFWQFSQKPRIKSSKLKHTFSSMKVEYWRELV